MIHRTNIYIYISNKGLTYFPSNNVCIRVQIGINLLTQKNNICLFDSQMQILNIDNSVELKLRNSGVYGKSVVLVGCLACNALKT